MEGCYHCEKMTPELAKAADILAKDPANGRIVDVDGPKNRELTNALGIRGYPILKLFNKEGEPILDYEGPRKAEDIVDFVKAGNQCQAVMDDGTITEDLKDACRENGFGKIVDPPTKPWSLSSLPWYVAAPLAVVPFVLYGAYYWLTGKSTADNRKEPAKVPTEQHQPTAACPATQTQAPAESTQAPAESESREEQPPSSQDDGGFPYGMAIAILLITLLLAAAGYSVYQRNTLEETYEYDPENPPVLSKAEPRFQEPEPEMQEL